MADLSAPSGAVPTSPSLRERVTSWAQSPHALWLMMLVAVADGSVFPIPPFAIFIPMVLAKPEKTWFYATLGTLASLCGGAIGYGLGSAIASGVTSVFSVNPALPIHISLFGKEWLNTTLSGLLTQNFWLLALACSIAPTPYKIVAIGSGFLGVAPAAYALASVLGRSARFFGVAVALRLFGDRARAFFAKKT